MGALQRMPRTGHIYLGTGSMTVAEHVFRTVMIGYTLAKMENADTAKVMLMCQFHDVEEARAGDLNYLQQRYVKSDDEKALHDSMRGLPFADDIHAALAEYAAQESREAVLAKEADVLELVCMLKEELDKGNRQAENWLSHAQQRLKTETGQQLFRQIMETAYFDWWYRKDHDWENGTKQW